ncbi:MAG TPA: hypothetical protein VEX67_17505 [Solirubrobacteraceae bacterium]|nr:hypothetical protein [Solirubrobacteraceae bacterium]
MTNRDRTLLVQLADGTLSGRRREQAEKRLARIPDGAERLERQRRVAQALRSGPATPPTLTAASVPAPRRSRFRAVPLAVAATVAAVVAVFVAQLAGEPSTLTQAADLAKRDAERPAPATAGPALREEFAGVTFPEWDAEFGWRATGARSDRLDGRSSRTVYYEHTGHRIAYTVLSGPPLEVPDHARRIRRDGLEIALYRDSDHGGHDVAIFERNGRTCVLAGHVMRTSTLVKLAAWTGDGTVRS